MSIELNEEWIKDNALAGNYNSIFPLLQVCIKNHSELTPTEKKRLVKSLRNIQKVLLEKTCFRVFKGE